MYKKGQIVVTPNGRAEICRVDIIGRSVRVEYLEGESSIIDYKFSDIKKILIIPSIRLLNKFILRNINRIELMLSTHFKIERYEYHHHFNDGDNNIVINFSVYDTLGIKTSYTLYIFCDLTVNSAIDTFECISSMLIRQYKLEQILK
jgi:hypothetical protein